MKRIRGRARKAIREAVLRRDPLCAECAKKNRIRLATQVDHIIPLHQGGLESPDPFLNRQGLCDPCHEEKSKRERGHTFNPKRTIGTDGWPKE